MRCSVCGHVSRPGEPNISFHRFPTDKNLYKAWCSAVGPNFSPSKTAVICSQHFLDTCLFYYPGGTKQRRYIKKGSIPTIFGLKKSKTCRNKPAESTIEEIVRDESLKQTEEISQINVKIQNECNIKSLSMSKEIPDNLIARENNDKEVPNVNFPQKRLKNFSLRYAGDYYHNDFGSRIKASKCWSIVLNRIEMQRRKIKTLQQQNRRLQKRLSNFKSLLSEITNNYVILKNPEDLL
ncbi:THAP domain-containing protein 1-like [Cardiocondyla obscurior]|uniref:THAP domain-containing protein 1-like n=1 Tax=Cardiocondyla obscurior TaxID=286306 RepID=UPI0039656C1D